MKKAIEWLIHDRSDAAMLARTVLEAVAAYVSANIVMIMNLFNLNDDMKLILMGLFTAIYSAVLSAIRKSKSET